VLDVVVIGGGPAGASAARLLASWGHDVALACREAPPAGWLAESIPASARKLFDALGLLDALDSAGFHPNGGNTVWWAGADERRESFAPGGAGVHAERAALEEALLRAARDGGVRVRRGAPIRRVARTPEGWLVESRDARLEARWLLDASGRAGVLGRAGRREDPGTSTLALVGRWRREDGPADADATHTLIESYRDGWAWSVPLAADIRCVTAMVDPRRTDLRRDGRLEATLTAELEKTRHLRGRLAGWSRQGPVRACPASLYAAERSALDRAFLVGDAACFIDPLSSYGVKKALASAWLAAVACNTALRDESAAASAAELFDGREREVYRRYRALSIPFFEDAARTHGHDFWTARVDAARAAAGLDETAVRPAAPPTGDPSDRLDPGADADALVGRRDVREAYEEIRRRPSVALERAPDARRVDAPLVAGNRVVLAPHLAAPSIPRPVRFVRNVDLLRLVDAAPNHARVPDLFEAYNAAGGPVSLPDFLAALATAVGTGLLTLAGWRAASG